MEQHARTDGQSKERNTTQGKNQKKMLEIKITNRNKECLLRTHQCPKQGLV